MKKIILWVILAIIVVYTVWLGVNILSYKQYESLPLQDEVYEIRGVYHIHTKHSDGYKSPEKIAKIASKANLDFIIITDHGNPNRASMATAGWKNGVLVLAGSEISVSRGHLVALGFESPDTRFDQKAENAAYQVSRLKGFTIIAHPYSKVNWTWGEYADYSGVEIINADSLLKSRVLRWIPYLPALIVHPKFFLLKILKYPERNIKKWDDLNQNYPMYGYYSSDAHLLYRPVMSFVYLHLLLDKPLSAEFKEAGDQVYRTLRNGRFYNAIDAAAQGEGFRFWCESAGNDIPMGGTSNLDKPVTIHISFPSSVLKEIHLIHNGDSILKSADDKINFEAEKPGTYRVEVYLREKSPLNGRIPWILSNPIFLKEKTR